MYKSTGNWYKSYKASSFTTTETVTFFMETLFSFSSFSSFRQWSSSPGDDDGDGDCLHHSMSMRSTAPSSARQWTEDLSSANCIKVRVCLLSPNCFNGNLCSLPRWRLLLAEPQQTELCMNPGAC
jgi:hypothetical protein